MCNVVVSGMYWYLLVSRLLEAFFSQVLIIGKVDGPLWGAPAGGAHQHCDTRGLGRVRVVGC